MFSVPVCHPDTGHRHMSVQAKGSRGVEAVIVLVEHLQGSFDSG